MFNGYTDNEIIQKILLGIPSNAEVLGFLCDHLRGLVWSVAHNCGIMDQGEIEYLLQEVVHDFYTNVSSGQFRQESKIKTYIYSIAKNKCFDKVRRRKLLELPTEPNKLAESSSGVTTESPEAIAILAEKMNIYNEFIDLFSPRCKEVIRIKINSPELSMEEIAQKLNYKSAHSMLSFISKCKKSLGNKIINDPILLGRLMDSLDDPYKILNPLIKYVDDFELILSYSKGECIPKKALSKIEKNIALDHSLVTLIDFLKSKIKT